VTRWFEVAEIKDKTASVTAKILDQVWFAVILDRYIA
jgi:hypothetical protein